jgi:hypothetical protein
MSDKAITIAHIVNPVIVGQQSDLHIAQPVTFESMRIAREISAADVGVELYTAQYAEDRAIIPAGFISTPDLDRSVMDFGRFHMIRKLPLLKDILDRLYQASAAEYMIYTNVDIALKPDFYNAVRKFIRSGIDGMVINRRTIPDKYKSVDEYPMMCKETGQPHYGYDCFVFRRESYPAFDLGNTGIGLMCLGAVLMLNIICQSRNFREFLDQHLTFHIGNSEVWRNPEGDDYQQYNRREYHEVLQRLAPRFDVNRLPVISRPFIMNYFEQIKRIRMQAE